MAEQKNLLVIAGLDPSGGAGLIADVRVAEIRGLRSVAVATALTVQDTSSVRVAEPVPPELLGEQLIALLSDIEVAAIKIGVVASPAHAQVIGDALQLTGAPVVWDPVLTPSRGTPLFDGDPGEALAALAPHLALLTPNLGEAGALSGVTTTDVPSMHEAGRALCERGIAAVLVKGGHLEGRAIDVLVAADSATELDGARIAGETPHGTGCALSTAIACALASGEPLSSAARLAKDFVAELIATPARPGRGRSSAL